MPDDTSKTLEKKQMTLSDEYLTALRIYHEFKKLREQMGKPLREDTDPEQILKDLRGEGFSPIGTRIDKKGTTRKTRHIVTTRFA